MATVVAPPRYLFGTHSLAIYQDAATRACQTWNTSASIAAAAPPTVTNFPAASEFQFGTHSLAIMQDHAARFSKEFPPVNIPSFIGFSMARDFIICEQDFPFQPQSFYVNNSALISGAPSLQNPILHQVYCPQIFPLAAMPAQATYFQPSPPPFVPVVTIYLVQATGIGWSIDPFNGDMILRNTGDVFYIAVTDFMDSSIDYLAGQPGSPFFGWMKIVPPGTPLTNPTHYGIPFYDFQPPPRRITF